MRLWKKDRENRRQIWWNDNFDGLTSRKPETMIILCLSPNIFLSMKWESTAHSQRFTYTIWSDEQHSRGMTVISVFFGFLGIKISIYRTSLIWWWLQLICASHFILSISSANCMFNLFIQFHFKLFIQLYLQSVHPLVFSICTSNCIFCYSCVHYRGS